MTSIRMMMKRSACCNGMSVQAPDETEKCISTPMKASAHIKVMMPQLRRMKRSVMVRGAGKAEMLMYSSAFDLSVQRRKPRDLAARRIAQQRGAHDCARDRARHRRAAAAMLNHDSAGITRRVPRAEAGEQRIIPQAPGQIAFERTPRARSAAVMTRDLRRAGFAGDAHRLPAGLALRRRRPSRRRDAHTKRGRLRAPPCRRGSLQTPNMPSRTRARCSAAMPGMPGGARGASKPGASRTRRGVTARPLLPMRAAITANCSGVHSRSPWPMP